jgi:membrane protease YdiL (CAAX protease family)
MNLTDLFIDDNRLRPIWRFFLSLVLLYLAAMLSHETRIVIYHLTNAHPSQFAGMFYGSMGTLIAVFATFKLMMVIFDRRPLASMGLAFHSRWWRELTWGLVVGAAMLLIAVASECAGGFARFTFVPHTMIWTGLSSFALFAVAATNEEAIFRGYPFQRLVESITPLGAIAVTSAFFGLAHLANPNRTWISTLNTMLVGVPFAIAYLRTRSLWMPIGMHFIWNFLLDFLLGLPVSGLNLTASVLTAHVHGPVWLTGGDYGPEGGLLATIAILLGTVYLALTKRIYTTEEMKALVFAPSPSWSPDPSIAIFSTSPEEGAERN